MGRVQTAVRAAALRAEIVRLFLEGNSNEKIAELKSCTPQTINRHLKKYLETDSRFPAGIAPDQVAQMRSEQREKLESLQRKLLAEAHLWAEHKTSGIEEAGIRADKLCKLTDSFTRASERVSAMYGLDAPKPLPAPAPNVTNNNVFISGMIDQIKARQLAQANVIQIEDPEPRLLCQPEQISLKNPVADTVQPAT